MVTKSIFKIRQIIFIGFIYLFAFSIASLLSSCSTLQFLAVPPKVEMKSVSISNVSIKGIDLNINLEVVNPNQTPLTIDKFVYDLSIGDSSFFNGTLNKPVELKASETSLVTIPVRLEYENARKAVENYLFKSVRTYKIKGSVTSGLFTVPISDEGKIEIKK